MRKILSENKSLIILLLIVFLSMIISINHILNTATSSSINHDVFNHFTDYEYGAINDAEVLIEDSEYFNKISFTNIDEPLIIAPFSIDVTSIEKAEIIPENVSEMQVDMRMGGSLGLSYEVIVHISLYDENEQIYTQSTSIIDVNKSHNGVNKLYEIKLLENAKYYKIYFEIKPLVDNVSGYINASYLDINFD